MVDIRVPLIRLALILPLLCGWQTGASAHAFLVRSEPGVGADLSASPQQVVLYFDSELEMAFSGFVVQDANGQEIRKNVGQGDANKPMELALSLPLLQPDTYQVLWSVVARDGHRTEGNFTFSVH